MEKLSIEKIISQSLETFKNCPYHKDCENCNGTGEYETTYNPKSKWDWYRVGGRWDGVVQSKERESKDGGFNFGDEHKQLKYNFATVQEVFDNEVSFFAVVTPDGEWHEEGKMGWFAIVTDEKDCDLWEKQKIDILTKYQDHHCVGLDCHI